MANITVDELVKIYNMEPHPEGGYYKEIYRSSSTIPANVLPEHGGNRNYCTDIYYLLPKGSISKIHKIKSDEMWHFYLGDPMTLVLLSIDGGVKKITLGHDVKSGEMVQYPVPAGHWFGAYPNPGSRFSFVGCTVAPGFDFADFELGNREQLLKEYPHAKEVIELLGH